MSLRTQVVNAANLGAHVILENYNGRREAHQACQTTPVVGVNATEISRRPLYLFPAMLGFESSKLYLNTIYALGVETQIFPFLIGNKKNRIRSWWKIAIETL